MRLEQIEWNAELTAASENMLLERMVLNGHLTGGYNGNPGRIRSRVCDLLRRILGRVGSVYAAARDA